MFVPHRHQEMLSVSSTSLPAFFYVLPVDGYSFAFIIAVHARKVNCFVKIWQFLLTIPQSAPPTAPWESRSDLLTWGRIHSSLPCDRGTRGDSSRVASRRWGGGPRQRGRGSSLYCLSPRQLSLTPPSISLARCPSGGLCFFVPPLWGLS